MADEKKRPEDVSAEAPEPEITEAELDQASGGALGGMRSDANFAGCIAASAAEALQGRIAGVDVL